MKLSLVFSHLSKFDLEGIIEYYYNVSPKTASKYYQGIIKSTNRLISFPEIGRIVPEFEEDYIDKYREIIYEHYRIIYKIERTSIFIIRIVDSRRLLTIDFIETK